jgi:hypothetical protein
MDSACISALAASTTTAVTAAATATAVLEHQGSDQLHFHPRSVHVEDGALRRV